jgi:hypothetical protein
MSAEKYLQKMKEDSAETLKRLQAAAAEHADTSFRKGTHLRKRIKRALAGTADGTRMAVCADGGAVCGSIFCNDCRERKQNWMLRIYRARAAEMTEPEARARLRHVTILHEIVGVMDNAEVIEIDKTIELVTAAAEDLRREIANMGRALKRQGHRIWLRGGIHIELLDMEWGGLLKSRKEGNKKAKVMLEWFEKRLEKGEFYDFEAARAFVVHAHVLVDLNELDENEWKATLKARWGETQHQTHSQRTWSKIGFRYGGKVHKLDDALKGMARYCFNGSNAHLQFQKFFGAGEWVTEGDEQPNEETGVAEGFAKKLHRRQAERMLNDVEIRLLVLTHNAVAGMSNRGLTLSLY